MYTFNFLYNSYSAPEIWENLYDKNLWHVFFYNNSLKDNSLKQKSYSNEKEATDMYTSLKNKKAKVLYFDDKD